MADIALDYGSADANQPTLATPMQDDSMDDDPQSSNEQPQQQASRFYALPTDQAVEAGAQRGPAPLSSAEAGLDDAALVGVEQPGEAPDPPAVEGGSDIRLETLLIEGLPITQLSTSRLFAYLTHFGAQPLGLEWIDDQRCKVVFADERSARLGLEYLLPAPATAAADDEMQPVDNATPLPNIDTLLEYEPDSWHSEYITSLVTPRKAHRIPAKLYTHVERQAACTELEEQQRMQDAVSSLPDDVPEIYREMEEADRRGKLDSREVRDLHKLRSTLWIRHAVTDWDRKESRASTRSQWYKQHGYEAGREIVPKLLQVGEVRESIELFPDYKPSADSSSHRESRKRGDEKRRMEELDSELDRYLASKRDDDEPERKAGEMMADAVQARHRHSTRQRDDDRDLMDRLSSRRNGDRRQQHSRRTEAQRGGRWTHDAYDSLSDASRAGRRSHRADRDALEVRYRRELSPSRAASGEAGRVKVKGRGRMKAPGGSAGLDRWAEEDKSSLAGRIGTNNLRDRLGGSNSLADRFS
ncbi:hypothetical protein EX895_001216 [Sporisorium graminicola]|uniref:Uncharacterized protein n=1 Tax=Sporisorium graminicola TaxID=280036 RepID=A0A4V6EUA9_9BASI|nr:hypothetical protein EX895_001216 [Sporisorium graminicola]TKY89919.1 hypothetical protein EX895_001216 [Sporisorium graminicola]